MKSVLAIFVFCLISISLLSQDFAPIGATWYYTIMESPWADQITIGFVKIEAIEDTIIESKTCRVLRKTFTGSKGEIFNWGDDIIYSDKNKVYHYSNSEFYLLYNFNALAGDTLYHKNDKIFLVDSTSTMMIDSIIYKTIYMKKDPGFYYENPILDGVGDIGGYLFPQEYGLIDEYVPDGLRCYEDTIIGFALSDNPCDYVYRYNNTVQTHFDAKIKFYPNPTTGQLNIIMDPEEMISIEIFDIRGKSVLLYETKVNSIIDINHLDDGLYFTSIRRNGKPIITKKIIKY